MIEQHSSNNSGNSGRRERAAVGSAFTGSWVGRAYSYLTGTGSGRYAAAFGALCLVALALRLWELGGRTMHYDEAIHLYYAWRLSNLEGFVHSPWMHGPFQIELVALFLKLLGDSDFTGRLAYALFGVALVALPYFLRSHLGASGAFLAGLMLAVSPSLLYFSRFGRNDIIMVTLAVSLFILLWRYSQTPRNRHLYIASALLAIAFASKETAYIISATFGALALLLSIPFDRLRRSSESGSVQSPDYDSPADAAAGPVQARSELEAGENRRQGLVNRATGRLKDLKPGPAAGFLVLLVTLTLPQWSAGVELAREVGGGLAGLAFGQEAVDQFSTSLGLDLVGREGVGQGIVGAPLWEGPFVKLPLTFLPAWIPAALGLSFIGLLMWAGWKQGHWWRQRLAGLLLPIASASVALVALVKPMGYGLDLPVAVCLSALLAVGFVYSRIPWKRSLFLIFLPLILSLDYSFLFLSTVQVEPMLGRLLPEGIHVESAGNALPLNYLAALGILLATTAISLIIGLLWKGGVWLVCAAIFYSVWVTLFTTFFTNPVGIFSGAWQGMGYWIAQQEVARGNQPWYYYFVGMSVYEFLPTIFGVLGAIVFVRRRDRLGVALSFWAIVNLIAYTVASEKMPWLLVNITVPFILLAGKLLGELIEKVDWRSMAERGHLRVGGILLVAPPLAVACAVYSALSLTGEVAAPDYLALTAAACTAGLAVLVAWLVRRTTSGTGVRLVTLGIACLMLVFTAWAAFQVTYTFDDSRREILVYAQGSQDIRESYEELAASQFQPAIFPKSTEPTNVDYDVWYPFQWYSRHWEKEGLLRFTCFKDEGGKEGCSAPSNDRKSPVVLVAAHNRPAGPGVMTGYQQFGPRRNLLWFPETYRRPAENRQEEGPWEEFSRDLRFFGEAVTAAENWNEVMSYLVLRHLEADWFEAEYYTYRLSNTAGVDPVN